MLTSDDLVQHQAELYETASLDETTARTDRQGMIIPAVILLEGLPIIPVFKPTSFSPKNRGTK
jgi:hypothetical protein